MMPLLLLLQQVSYSSHVDDSAAENKAYTTGISLLTAADAMATSIKTSTRTLIRSQLAALSYSHLSSR